MLLIKDIRGVKIACWMSDEQFTQGHPALLCIHGSGGDHTVWVNQYARMKSDFHIAAVELPGHGRSEGPGEQDVTAYAEWIRSIMEGFGIKKPLLIGHSIGAAIALTFAIKYPELISGIIPVGGGVKMPVNPSILEGLKKDPAPVLEMIVKFSITKENRERLGEPLLKSLKKGNPDILYGDLIACERLNLAEDIARIKVPTLVVCGTDDKMTPPAFSNLLAEKISGAKLALIPNAGHFVMIENVEGFNDAIRSFALSLSS